MIQPKPLPSAFAARPFTVAEAREAGVDRNRLYRSDLAAPHRGVRVRDLGSGELLDRCRALQLLLDEEQFFSHETAAQLHALRLPPRSRALRPLSSAAVHVSSRAPRRAPRVRGVQGHQVTRAVTVVERDGLRMSDPISTWVLLARFLSVEALVVMADGLLSRRHPLCGLADLAAAVASGAAAPGGARFRAALERVREGTDSAMETVLRLLLVDGGLPEPEVNAVIRRADGGYLARGDLVYRAQRVVVEYDGAHHREDERQFHIDVERLDALMAEGWRVIRVDRLLVAQPEVLVARVGRALLT